MLINSGMMIIVIKKAVACAVFMLLITSCSYSVYHVNKGSTGIKKKDSYLVTYSAIIPDDTFAKITYISNDNSKVVLKHVTGKWEQSARFKTGQEMLFSVNVKLPKATPAKKLSSAITVDNEVFAEHILTGKNANFHVAFKLP